MNAIQVRLGLTALAVVALDQLSKVLAVTFLEGSNSISILGPLLKLSFARNPGAAFSVGTSATLVFTILAVAACVAIIWYSRRIISSAWATVFGAILGGALGNLLDRLFRTPQNFRGHVVDFIGLPNYPIFNLADSAIFCATIVGIALIIKAVPISRPKDQA